MKLKIENIGKINKAEIYLDGITVIAGVNDTGKSTVGKSLFALCDAFYKTGESIYNERLNSIVNAIVESISRNFNFPIFNQLIISTVSDIINCDNYDKIKEMLMEIPQKMYRMLTPELSREYPQHFDLQPKSLEAYTSDVFSKIKPALKMDNSAILTGIVSRAIKAEFAGQVCYAFNDKQGKFTLSDNDGEVSITVENNQGQSLNIDNMNFQTKKAVYIDNAVSIDNNNRELYYIFSSLHNTTMYRKFGHRYLLKLDLVKSPEEYNLIDNLVAQEKLSLIMEMINQMSQGVLIQDRERGYWRYSITGQDKPILLDIENVSSGILAVATLKRLIENGSLQESGILILDEPETHLHPAWQNIFAEILVLLCKDFNFKILLNTHSHYFLTAIETFSRKYEIQDRCKYYLSYEENNMANFRDVTGNSEDIYKKFLQPIQDMQDLQDLAEDNE